MYYNEEEEGEKKKKKTISPHSHHFSELKVLRFVIELPETLNVTNRRIAEETAIRGLIRGSKYYSCVTLSRRTMFEELQRSI